MDKTKALKKVENDILNNLNCQLKDNAKNLVFGKGNINAEILFIGEAPGAREDETGIPFVGRAGKDLDKALNKIGLTLDDIYIANILKYRPPMNRDPTKEEIINHTPYLIEQIKIINPKIIATLGNFSTKFVLAGFNQEGMKKIKGITQIHGKEFEVKLNSNKYKVIPIYHPSAMVYRPRLREEFENDFKIFAKIINTKFIGAEKQKTLTKLFFIQKSNISGKGIFAFRDLKKDQELGIAFEKVLNTGNLDNDYIRTNLGAFVNHSTSNNLILKRKGEKFIYITKKKIKKNEELLLNYNEFPWEGKRNFN